MAAVLLQNQPRFDPGMPAQNAGLVNGQVFLAFFSVCNAPACFDKIVFPGMSITSLSAAYQMHNCLM